MLRRSDGGAYQLQRPNDLLKSQDFWGDDKIRLHNFGWKDEILERRKKPLDLRSEGGQRTIRPVAREEETVPDDDRVTMNCLPVAVDQDDFYGEMRKTYGKPFECTATILRQSDMDLEFRTDAALKPGWIVYPMTADRRWWKVDMVSEGLVRAVISEFQATF